MFKRTLLVCAMSLLYSRQGNAAELDPSLIEFDSETLKSLGIDPNVSEYFAKKARFMPGNTAVNLTVNGIDKGNIVAHFNQNGELCFDRTLMEQASLRIPGDYKEGCYDYLKAFPEAVVNAIPGQELVELMVPPDEINRQRLDMTDFNMDGSGAMLNYNAMSSRNEYLNGTSTYSQAQLEGGINVASWLLRSQQLFSQSDGRFNSENGQTYLQHTFVGLHTTARMGEVNMNNMLLDGTGLYGLTLEPEVALETPEGLVKVSGIANTPQARVEVRQQGVMVYSTLVPVGPFVLTEVPLRNYNSDLNVTVVETDGSQHSYIVPSSLYMQRMTQPSGLYLSVGQVSDGYDKKPAVISASGGWRLRPETNVGLGIILAKDFAAAGGSLDTMLWSTTLLSFKAKQSFDHSKSLQGQSYRAEATLATKLGVSITASSTYYSPDYREFSEFIDKNYVSTKQYDYSVGLQWQIRGMGAFNTSLYETKTRGKEGKRRFITAGWGGNFYSAYISANWQRQLSGGKGDEKNEDMIYLNVTVPLGRNNLSTYAHRDNGRTRYGSTLNGNINDDNAYMLGAEMGREENYRSVSAGLSSNLHYSQLMLNGSVASEHQRSYSGSLQGGVVAHADGITFSPLPVRETFGIASLAEPVSGVKIDTPTGPVWTDSRGFAALPSLNAWQKSRIEINTTTLPKNMDIGNGTRMMTQGRGSVGKVQFNTLTQRRVLLHVTMADGKKLPKNLAITDEKGNYLTTSVDDGVVFLNNVTARQTLVIQNGNESCRITLVLPEKAEADVFYETAQGVCQ